MVARQPFDQEVEPTTAACGANTRPPARPAPDEVAEAHQAPDLAPRRVLEQANRGPVAVQTANRLPPPQHGAEELFVDVVVPDVRKPGRSGATVALDRVTHGLTVPPGAAATRDRAGAGVGVGCLDYRRRRSRGARPASAGTISAPNTRTRLET
jgi:hypothetical protein